MSGGGSLAVGVVLPRVGWRSVRERDAVPCCASLRRGLVRLVLSGGVRVFSRSCRWGSLCRRFALARDEYRGLQRLIHGQQNTTWMVCPERTVRRHCGNVLSESSDGSVGTPDFGLVDQR